MSRISTNSRVVLQIMLLYLQVATMIVSGPNIFNKSNTRTAALDGCDSTDCFGLLTYNGPWGGVETQYVQKQCYITVTELKNAGEFDVWLTLDRDTEAVTAYTLTLVDSLSDCSFSYTNAWSVNVGTFTFDLQLTYRVDQGNTEIPNGYCSVSPVTTACPSSSTAAAATSTTTTAASTMTSTTTAAATMSSTTTAAATTTSTTTAAATTTSTTTATTSSTTTAAATTSSTTTAAATATSTKIAAATTTSTTTATTSSTTTAAATTSSTTTAAATTSSTTAATTTSSTTTAVATTSSTITAAAVTTSTTTAASTMSSTTTTAATMSPSTTATTATKTSSSTIVDTTSSTTTTNSNQTNSSALASTTETTLTSSTILTTISNTHLTSTMFNPSLSTITRTSSTSTTTNVPTLSSIDISSKTILQIVSGQCDGNILDPLRNCKIYIIALLISIAAGGIISIVVIMCFLKKGALRKQANNSIGTEETNYSKPTRSRLTSNAKSSQVTKIAVHQIEYSEAWFYPKLGNPSTTKVQRIGHNESTFV